MTTTYFSTLDYILFGASLALSLSIGIYYGCIKRRQTSTTKELLFAGGNLRALPVAMSLVTTFMSAISLLGYPGEIYKYGTMFCYYGLMYFVVFPLAAFVFLPTLYKLQLPSIYQYLQLRFNATVKRCASFIFCLQTVLYLSAGLYAPALALNSVMKIPLSTSIIVTSFVCVFYTSIGGAKTVVWTNVYQFLLIIVGLGAVIFTGVAQLGSFSQVFTLANQGGRIVFDDFSFDPRVRHSFWSIMIGGTCTLLTLYSTNQMTVQRYVSMSSLRSAQKAVLLNIPLNLIIISCYTMIGLILFASYYGCNPDAQGFVKKSEEILPYFVVDKLSHLKGLPGVFVSAIYGAGLSTVSSGLNSLAAVVLEDCVKPVYFYFNNRTMPESTAAFNCKLIAFVFGMSTIFLAYLYTLINAPILQVALSLFGIGGGPILGLFCLGLFFKRPNSSGALVGLLVSASVVFWIGLSPIFTGLRPLPLPVSVQACNSSNFLNSTITSIPTTSAIQTFSNSSYNSCRILPSGAALVHPETVCDNALLEIYKLSYQYYSLLAVLLCVFFGYLTSLVTSRLGFEDYVCDENLHVHFKDVIRGIYSGDGDYGLADVEATSIQLCGENNNKGAMDDAKI